MQLDSDVIVIGSGPVGSRVAARLAHNGHDVIVLERHQALGQPVCCTGIISVQCFERFNIPPELVLREHRGAVINTPSGAVINISRPGVQAVGIDRSAFDRSMAETAVSSGARLHLGATVTEVTTHKNYVTVGFTRDGSPHSLQARSAVIAAGFSPRLTQPLGLGKISDMALGFQTEVETSSPVQVELFVDRNLTPGFFAWMAPVSDTRAKVGLLAYRREDANLRVLIETLRSQGKIGTNLDEVRCRPIPMSSLPRTYTDRVIVVGDSAGQVKPTTGGGIYFGLLCADIAGDTLGRALTTDQLSAGSLQEYEKTWRAAIGRDLLIGRLGRRVFQRLSNNCLNHLMLKARDSGVIDQIAGDNDLSFDWHGKAILKVAGTLLSSIF